MTNLTRPNARVVKFYNGRGTAEQWIKEGKNALRWTRLSCHAFRHNVVRLQLHALAYNLANFLRTLALPEEVEHWSLTTLRERLVKIGARIVRHGRYVVFQLAEVAVPRSLFVKSYADGREARAGIAAPSGARPPRPDDRVAGGDDGPPARERRGHDAPASGLELGRRLGVAPHAHRGNRSRPLMQLQAQPTDGARPT